MMKLNHTKQSLSMLYKGCGAALLAMAAAIPFGAEAKPAYPGIVNYELPDGSVLPVRMVGDEHAHRILSPDGYLLLTDADGSLVYATTDDAGNIVASGRKAVAVELRSDADKQFLASIDRDAMVAAASDIDNSRRQARKATLKKSQSRVTCSQGMDLLTTNYPSLGSPKALVILVQYKDIAFTTADAGTYFNEMLTKPNFNTNGGTGSALDYFTENSNGKFTPDFDILGPVTLSQRMKYYGGNTYTGDDSHPEEMVIEALQILDDEIDFSVYDTDGDGYIDNVYVFYAGKGEADGGGADTVWPHSWEIETGAGKKHVFDGVILNRYACSNEIDNVSRKADGIGTFVHEFSHVMGLPDLYETTYATGAFTPGAWSVLDYGPYNNNGRTPPNYGAFERYSLGWMEPRRFSGKATAEYTIPPITDNVAYLVETEYPNEFFLLESRARTGNDTYIPGEGMLVWYIDYDFNAWNYNSVNNTSTRQRVDIIEADGRPNESTRAGDSFPGTGHITEFTASTTPAFLSRMGKPVNVELTNIRRNMDGSVSFTATHDVDQWNAISSVAAEDGSWTLAGRTIATETELAIFTPAGMTVARLAAGQSFELPAAGVYIIRSASKTAKVAVK